MPARRRATLEEAPRFSPRATDVTLEEVVDERGRDAFARLPLELFKDDQNFVSPIIAERRDFIDPAKNPYFQHARGAFWLARRKGKVVGRIAAVNDARYNKFHDSDVGFFGFFDCENDPGVASVLLERAGAWIKSTGPRQMMGPLNFAFHHDCGLLVEGFDRPPSMNMPHNPRYYARLLEANGFAKHKDLWSYELNAQQVLPEKVERIAERARAQGVTIRRINLGDTLGEARRIKSIFESTLKPGWGFAPVTDEEFDAAVSRLRPLITLRPELCMAAEFNGEAVAFSITVPDANIALKEAGGYLSKFGLPIGLAKVLWSARKIDRVRVLLFAIRPGWRRRGIDALLSVETMKEAKRLGYRSGELGWTAEDDTLVNRTVQATGAKRIKVYRLYSRAV